MAHEWIELLAQYIGMDPELLSPLSSLVTSTSTTNTKIPEPKR